MTDDIEARLAEAFPDQFLRASLQAVFVARRLAWEYCNATYAFTEADNVRPWMARGNLEGLLRDVAGRFEGIEASVVKASNWNHTEWRSGNLVLTQNSVATPCGRIDTSEYRTTLAQFNRPLFDGFGKQDVPVDARLLALLLHSQNRLDRGEGQRYAYLAGSAYIAFPASDLKGYLHRINLFERFPDVVEAQMPKEWDEEARIRFMCHACRTGTE